MRGGKLNIHMGCELSLFKDRDEVEVHKLAKKERGQYPAILTSHLVNKGFIIWLLEVCLRETAGSPERARWLHLARSGSQSQRAIWFILPAHGASHIIRLDIGQVLFCVFMDRDESLLDRTNLVNKGFIIWLSGKFCLPDTAGSPEQWLHLARLGSQSQRAIWFIVEVNKHAIKDPAILTEQAWSKKLEVIIIK